MNWSEEQVVALSPDASSTKSGKDLARPEKWQVLARNERALWGEIRGSGSTPYRTQIDLQNVAFKCSCPSRKFPCKHGLGLFLIYARNEAALSPASPPDWVTEWLDKRQAKTEKKAEEPAAKAPDAAAQAKRAEAREAKVTAGLQEISLWVKDLVRNGLLQVPEKSHAFWQNPAARMVDAQAPGIAYLLRNLGNLNYFSEGWQTPLLQKLVQLYLLTQSYPNLSQLPPNLQADLRALIGFTQNQEELRSAEGVIDTWVILAKQTTEEASLYTQTYWLHGQNSNRFAMLLNHYHASKPTDLGLIPGAAISAELVYYPGSFPLRVLLKEQRQAQAELAPGNFNSLQEVQQQFAEAISVFPWLEQLPVLLKGLTPFIWQGKWFVKDEENLFVPVAAGFEQTWQLLAFSGGQPLPVFGLYNRHEFLPLGVWHHSNYILF